MGDEEVTAEDLTRVAEDLTRAFEGIRKFQAVVDDARAQTLGRYPYTLEITSELGGNFSADRFHSPAQCVGETCVIHNPSSHNMVWWPMHVRIGGLIERLCPHRVGHPDPDSIGYYSRIGRRDPNNYAHGCDGCCRPHYDPEAK